MLKNKKNKILVFSIFMVLFITILLHPFVAKTIYSTVKNLFASYPVPAHEKKRDDNHDGTYKLSLDVTGASLVNKANAKANILVVYDVSGSMEYNTYSYVKTNNNGNDLYGKDGSEYKELDYSVTKWVYKGTNTEYTGDYKYAESDSDYDNNPAKYGIVNNNLQRVYYNYYRFRVTDNWNADEYTGTRYTRSNLNGNFNSNTTYYAYDESTHQMVELEPVYSYSLDGEEYTGDRYTRTRTTRGAAAEKVVYEFADKLFNYNTDEEPNNVQMALIAFSSERNNATGGRYYGSVSGNAGTEETAAWTVQGWTNNESTFLNNLSNTGTSTNLRYGGGTNWEAALTRARNYVRSNATDSDPTYVIFVTDGAPTMYINDSTDTGGDTSTDDYTKPTVPANAIYNTNTATHTEDKDNRNTDIYGIFAYGTNEKDYLDDLIYYAHNGKKRPDSEGGVSGSTVATPHYYKASDTDSLNAAIADIFRAIVKALGVESVSISDGTTNVVKTTSGSISKLLEVDQSSYEYFMTIPTENVSGSTFKMTRVDLATGNPYDITLVDNEDGTVTATWELDGSHTSTLYGEIDNYGTFKYNWGKTGSTEFYPYAPTPASLNTTTGAVDWSLNNVGTLLNGVTYTVTFDVYPSQYVYDTVADLKNGLIEYNDLDENVRKYLHKDGNNYTLDTNTTASLTYKDTREENPEQVTKYYNDLDPVKAPASEIDVTKLWLNQLDRQNANNATDGKPLELYLLRDGEKIKIGEDESGNDIYEKLVVNSPNWMDSKYISVGSIRTIRNGQDIEVLTSGHEYTLEEPKGISYHWELEIEKVRPMLINGRLTTLVRVYDEDIISQMENTNYKEINGHHVYKIIDKEGDTNVEKIYYDKYLNDDHDTAKLNAINNRKSYLDITKIVDGDPTGGKEFDFTIKVDNYGDAKREVWFSVYDTINNVAVKDIETNATPEEGDTGYYYVVNGEDELTPITIKLQDGWNVRFINLGTGSTYEIVEDQTTMPELFTLGKIDGTVTATTTLDLPLGAVLQEDGTYIYDGVTYTEKTVTNDLGTYKYYEYEYRPTIEGSKVTGQIVTANTPYEVTYTNVYPKTHLDVVKKWIGQEKNVNVTLYQNGNSTNNTLTLSENNGYKGSFEKLDIKDLNENLYNYSAIEQNLEGYKTVYSGTENIVVTAKNKEDVTVTISGAGEDIILTLNEENNYTATQEVSYINENGTLKEITVEADKEITYLYTDRVVNITNIETTEVEVTKVWKDDSDRDGIRPTKLNINLIGKVTIGENEQTVVNTSTEVTTSVSEDTNTWTYKFENLDKYYVTNDEIGNEIKLPITYTADEASVPTGYSKAVDGYTITNTHEPAKHTDITITKVWEDDSDRDDIRPEELEVKLTATDSDGNVVDVDSRTTTISGTGNTWTYTFTNLPAKANGKELTYTIDETSVPEGYSKSVDGYTITNTHEPAKHTDITITKVWEDDSDRDDIRPEELEVKLTATDSDGKVVDVDSKTVTINGTGNTWTYTFRNLPAKANGKELTYTIDETSVPTGYSKSVDNNTYTITNTHTPQKIDNIIATKVWEDDSDRDDIRPDSITYVLIGTVNTGTSTDTVVRREKTVTGQGNTWTVEFDNINMYDKGRLITYTIDETTLPEGYSKSIDNKTYTITNTHEPAKHTDITITKV